MKITFFSPIWTRVSILSPVCLLSDISHLFYPVLDLKSLMSAVLSVAGELRLVSSFLWELVSKAPNPIVRLAAALFDRDQRKYSWRLYLYPGSRLFFVFPTTFLITSAKNSLLAYNRGKASAQMWLAYLSWGQRRGEVRKSQVRKSCSAPFELLGEVTFRQITPGNLRK